MKTDILLALAGRVRKDNNPLKEIRTCIVCGSEFLKTLRKDSKADLCSTRCRSKYRSRTDAGMPVNNTEYKKKKAEMRASAPANKMRIVGAGPKMAGKKEISIRIGDESACLCKRKDCMYRGSSSGLHTCDYFLVTGKRRGCPAYDCDKYKPGRRAIVQPM